MKNFDRTMIAMAVMYESLDCIRTLRAEGGGLMQLYPIGGMIAATIYVFWAQKQEDNDQ